MRFCCHAEDHTGRGGIEGPQLTLHDLIVKPALLYDGGDLYVLRSPKAAFQAIACLHLSKPHRATLVARIT
jgi:hypothetical protein